MSAALVARPDVLAIEARFSNGKVFNLESHLFDSIYSHQVPPSDVLKIVAKLDEAQQAYRPVA